MDSISFSGLSMFYFNPQAENANGEGLIYNLFQLKARELPHFLTEEYRLAQFAIPFGGIKFSLNKVSNIIIEYS